MPGDECVSDGLGSSFHARAGGQPETVRKSRQPALWTRCSPPRGPAGTWLGVGGMPGEIITGQTCLPNTEPWGGPPGWGRGSAASLTPAWVDTGAGGMLQPGSFTEQPNRRPSLCPRGQPRLGCSCRFVPRGCSTGHPPPTPWGDVELTVPRHPPAARGRQVRSGRWPRGSGMDPSGRVARGVS